jgi:hypothetical protein
MAGAATPEEALRIARHLLLSSPPGQWDSILSNVQTILGKKGQLTEGQIKEIHAAYQERSGCGVLLEKESVAAGSTPHVMALKQELEGYTQTKFGPKAEVAFSLRPADPAAVKNQFNWVIHLYAQRIDLPNHVAGSWYSTYEVQFTSPKEASITSQITHVWAHAMEDSNIQFELQHKKDDDSGEKTTPKITATVTGSTATVLAKAIVAQIHTWEVDQCLATRMAELYENCPDMLKELRRIMPITRTRMNWNLVTHQVAQQMKATANSAKP